MIAAPVNVVIGADIAFPEAKDPGRAGTRRPVPESRRARPREARFREP